MALPSFESLQAFLADCHIEVLMFVLVFVIHYMMFHFKGWLPLEAKAEEQEKKAKISSTAPPMSDECSQSDRLFGKKESRVQEKMDMAYQKGLWSATLKYWHAQRDSDAATPGQLLQVVEAMQRLNMDGVSKVTEVRHFLLKHKGSCHIGFINRLFTSLVKSMDVDLIAGMFYCLGELNIEPDSQTYEMLIQLHFTMQNMDQMLMLAEEMETKGVLQTTATKVTLLKGALKMGDLDKAIPLYCQVYEACPSYVPTTLASLACRMRQGARVIGCFESKKLPFQPEVLDVMLRTNLQMRDKKLAIRILKLYKLLGIEGDPRNKAVLTRGSVLGDGEGQLDALSGGLSVASHRQPASTAFAASDTSLQETAEQFASAKNQPEPIEEPRDQWRKGGMRTPQNLQTYRELNNRGFHRLPSSVHGNHDGKWVQDSADPSWGWASRSCGSAKQPWLADYHRGEKEQYQQGSSIQPSWTETTKNTRKTWVPTEKLHARQATSQVRIGMEAARPELQYAQSSRLPPPGLTLEREFNFQTSSSDNDSEATTVGATSSKASSAYDSANAVGEDWQVSSKT